MEVKPAEFARMAGVTRQSVYSKIKNHTLIVNTAGLLDTDNSLNSRYMADQRRKAVKVAPAQLGTVPPQEISVDKETSVRAATPGQMPPLRTNADIAADTGVPQELLDLPLRELVIRYGSFYALERQAKFLQSVTATNEKYQRTQERSLKLIPKDFVQGTVFTFLKSLARQILEYPDTAADDIIGKVQAHGADAKPEIITLLRNGMGRIIAGAKDEVNRDLQSLKGKYQTSEKPDEPGEGVAAND